MAALRGRTALVTGAAKRIGRAIALGLAGEGMRVIVHYHRSSAAAAETVEACRALGVEAETLAGDLGEASELERVAAAAAEIGIDVFVHNASTFTRLPFLESPAARHAEILERDLRIHVTAPYVLSRVLGERMVERGFGRIVLFGDWSSEAAVYRHYAPYVVSKAAVPTLAKTLALELGARSAGVTVNAIAPGPIVPAEGHPTDDTEMVKRQTILGRWVGTEDVVRAVVFLAASDQVTGITLRVDGGRAVKAL